MSLRKFFSKIREQKPEPRKHIQRASRVALHPLFPLLDIQFLLVSPIHEEPLQILNISTSGIAFFKGSLREVNIKDTWQGNLDVGGVCFPTQLAIARVSNDSIGAAFVSPSVDLARAIAKYLSPEISAVNMTAVPSDNLQPEPDGTPYWFHGENNCELHMVCEESRVLRFHLVFFGNYLEGGAGLPLKFGQVAADEVSDKPGYKGSSMIKGGLKMDSELKQIIIRFLKHIEKISPQHKESLIELIEISSSKVYASP